MDAGEVGAQGSGVREGGGAHVAGVGPLSCVAAAVDHQAGMVREPQPTDVARVGALSWPQHKINQKQAMKAKKKNSIIIDQVIKKMLGQF